MKLKNKKVGAKVLVKKILVEISPKAGWRYIKNIEGTLVERKGIQDYYYTSSGANTYPRKHNIDTEWQSPFAVKLDGDIVDIAGNNVICCNEWEIKFLEYLDDVKIISKKEYNKALKIIEEYNYQQTLK